MKDKDKIKKLDRKAVALAKKAEAAEKKAEATFLKADKLDRKTGFTVKKRRMW